MSETAPTEEDEMREFARQLFAKNSTKPTTKENNS